MSEFDTGLLHTGALLMLILDREGRILLWNRGGSVLTGYTFDEVRGRPIWEVLSAPEEVEETQRILGLLRSGVSPSRMEGYVVTKAGERRWITWSVDATQRPDGSVEFLIVTGIDRTHGKRAEESLRKSEATLAGIISIAADAIITIDEEQRIIVYNQGAEEIFGWSREEALGKPLDILLPERIHEIHRRHIQNFAREPVLSRRLSARRKPILGLRKNGEEFPAEAAISKLDVNGTWLFTVVLRDVTLNRRLEREHQFLAEVGTVLAGTLSYDELLPRIAQLAVQSLADCCIIDLFEEAGQVRRVSVTHRDPKMARLAETLQNVPLDRHHDHPTEVVRARQQSVLLSEITEEYLAAVALMPEHLWRLPELKPTSILGVPLGVRGALLGVLLLLSTDPHRRYGPEDLRLAEALAYRAALALDNARLHQVAQQAIQVRDDVLSIVAHDLRNPLNTARLAVGALTRNLPEEGPARVGRKTAETISRSINRADHLIQDLLDVARIDAGRLAVEQGAVSSQALASDVAESFAPLVADASLELHVAVPAEQPVVLVDRERILQVFANLIGNAIKFTPPGGHIFVTAEPCGDALCFSVTDTGPGIPPEHLPHLFDRFWQARRADRRGSGLGLPIARGIVEAHGGRIWAESRPGHGSTFSFTVPFASGAEAHPAQEPAPPG